LFDDFFVTRKPLKSSPHTEAVYRSDLIAISVGLAADLATEPDELRLGPVTASITRALVAWNQLFSFLVADEVVVGNNSTAAVAKPKVPARAPKALQGADERHSRAPAPSRGWQRTACP
jgi:site-specific recombinase XerC